MKPYFRLRVIALLFLGACETLSPPSPRELCRRRADVLSQLYAEYGGHPLLTAAQGQRVPAGAAGVVDELIGAATAADESSFDDDCESIGAGGKPDVFASKARTFFARDDVRTRCRTVVDLDDKLAEANAKLPEGQRVACP